jgi:hypothetical protein
MITSAHTLCHSLASGIERCIALLGPVEAIMHVVQQVFQVHQSRFGSIGDGLRRRTWLGRDGLVAGE